MISKEIILAAAIFLSIIYLVIGAFAFHHTTDEEKKDKMHFILLNDFWWPFYRKIYTDGAKKFCLAGKILAPLIAGLYIWYIVIVIP